MVRIKNNKIIKMNTHNENEQKKLFQSLNLILKLGRITAVNSTSILSYKSDIILTRKVKNIIYNIITLILYITSAFLTINSEVIDDSTTSANIAIIKTILDPYLYIIYSVCCIILGNLRTVDLKKLIKKLKLADVGLPTTFSCYFKLVGVAIAGIPTVFLVTSIAFFTETVLGAINKFFLASFVYGIFAQLISCFVILQSRFKVLNVTLKCKNCDFKQLFRTYHVLCDALEALNGIFGVQILGLVILVFLSTLFALFGVFKSTGNSGFELFKEILKNAYMSVFLLGAFVVVVANASVLQERVSRGCFFINKTL